MLFCSCKETSDRWKIIRLTGEEKNFPLANVMNGGLDAMIDALVTADQAEKLREASEA